MNAENIFLTGVSVGKALKGVDIVQSGGNGPIDIWDFTSATPLVGTLRGITLTGYNMTFDSSGALFDSASDYILIGAVPPGNYAFEVDVTSMSLASLSSHQRFIMGTSDGGLIYRATSHQWEFYGNNAWAASSGEGAGDFFNGATVRCEVDVNGYWHIYKDGVLWYEPTRPQTLSSVRIGSNTQSIQNAAISDFRWM